MGTNLMPPPPGGDVTMPMMTQPGSQPADMMYNQMQQHMVPQVKQPTANAGAATPAVSSTSLDKTLVEGITVAVIVMIVANPDLMAKFNGFLPIFMEGKVSMTGLMIMGMIAGLVFYLLKRYVIYTV